MGGVWVGRQPCVDADVISSPASRQWFDPPFVCSTGATVVVTIFAMFEAFAGDTRVPAGRLAIAELSM